MQHLTKSNMQTSPLAATFTSAGHAQLPKAARTKHNRPPARSPLIHPQLTWTLVSCLPCLCSSVVSGLLFGYVLYAFAAPSAAPQAVPSGWGSALLSTAVQCMHTAVQLIAHDSKLQRQISVRCHACFQHDPDSGMVSTPCYVYFTPMCHTEGCRHWQCCRPCR